MTSAPIPLDEGITGATQIDVARVMPWLVGTLVVAVGVMLVDSLPVGVVHDDGMYVILAKSLATGQGYRWLNLPGAPAATHFPPGYPAVLALLWWIYPVFPGNVILFKIANALFCGIAAAGTARFAHSRLGLSARGAAAFTLVAMLGVPTLALSVMVMSEPLFLAVLLPILLMAERLADSERPARRELLLLGLAAGVATLVRTHGIALIAAIPLVLVIRRRRLVDAALCVAAAVAVVLPWQLWVSMHAGALPMPMRGNYESYGAWLVAGFQSEGIALLGRTAAQTGTELLAMFATLAVPSMPAVIRITALIALGALAVVGLRSSWRLSPVTTLFIGFYFAIVILWPFAPTRFAWGVWPLVLMPLVLGARSLIAWRPATSGHRVLRTAAITATIALALGHATYTLRGYRGQWWQSIPKASAATISPVVFWAARHTGPRDLLAVEAESAVYLYAERGAVPVHTFTVKQYFHRRTARENAAVIRAILATYPVDAILVSSPPMREAARELATIQPPFATVRDTFPGGLVLVPSRQ